MAGMIMTEETPIHLPRENSLHKWLLFVAASLAVWALYFWWRPPAPMLFLKRQEHLGRDVKAVSLTIDDAPHPLTTPLLLASLKRADVKATFFVVGEGLRIYPELAHRIVADGHRLANHSHPHHNLTTVAPAFFPQHIDACFAAIENVGRDAGIPQQTRLFRPPGGGLNREAMDYLYRRGHTLAWWSNNVGDWTCPPAWKIADGVKANLKGGDILLLHDGGTGTPQAIPAIVKEARKRGFHFVLMPE
jgi:peptidoglycan/xylan/chitin deacetylase (PgdA/CDA1 family)